MNDDIEQIRIAAYARGWNDASLGREPRDIGMNYLLGYRDATRSEPSFGTKRFI